MKYLTFITVLISILLSSFSWTIDQPNEKSVRIWEEKTVIPTYLVDPPDLNPRFYDGRAYQGAQGRVYPYPIYESLSDTRVEKEYTMVCLENEYIKIEVLPEIGGRLFGAVDKTNGYVYVYRQHVIKPALIGMLGAWISGGIEWNFPHHHRATAFMPVEYQLEENEDGSATLWISELEIRHRMKFMLGISLFPGKSYFEITFRPLNRTPFIHSFLYFANTGVHTNEEYQVIFPPNTEFGTYHGKNQFIQWPLAYEVYNRVDYTDGIDVSWWKNHPEWTSIFAWNYEDDFVAGYDHSSEAGTLLYANHHIGPGKKFWTWSTGPRGQLWDKALTEIDGPELELMIGGYSDNQPDYSWVQPYESKLLKQYWYPIRNIGGIKNATLEAAVNLEFKDRNQLHLFFNATSKYQGVESIVLLKGKPVFKQKISIDPGNPFTKVISIKDPYEKSDIRVALIAKEGDTLVAYQPRVKEKMEMPETAKPPLSPSEIKTVEELYLAGLRLEQFYNPSLDPMIYYREALKRDPGNYRINIAIGMDYLRRGMFHEAELKFKTAVKRITGNHTKSRDGEGYYYLGLTQKFLGNLEESYKNLYQATWSLAYHSAAYYLLAEINCIKGEFNQALTHLNRSISTNVNNTKALNLRTAVLRKLGDIEASAKTNTKVIEEHPLNFWSMFENYFLTAKLHDNKVKPLSLQKIKEKMGNYIENYLELSLDYGDCGMWKEAVDVLSMIDISIDNLGSRYPMVYYYLAWYYGKLKNQKVVDQYLKFATEMPLDYCFPFRLESIEVLNFAIENNPQDARAMYYLGNLLYEWQPEKALKAWESSVSIDDQNPIAFRNLGMAYNKTGIQKDKALEAYEKAIELKGTDQRLLYEQDLIMAENRIDPAIRLRILQDHHESIANNNVSDALSREVMLHVQLGNYDNALNIISKNYFRQWEGVSKAYDSFVDAHLLKGLEYLEQEDNEKALKEFLSALEYPENMMVAQPYRGGRECQIYYYVGLAYEYMNKNKKANEAFSQAAEQRLNENLSDIYYFRAMSLKKLGQGKKSEKMLHDLIALGQDRLTQSEVDFFAKFGEKETPEDKASNAWYLIGLGYLGLEDQTKSREAFEKTIELNVNHIWGKANLSGLITF